MTEAEERELNHARIDLGLATRLNKERKVIIDRLEADLLKTRATLKRREKKIAELMGTDD